MHSYLDRELGLKLQERLSNCLSNYRIWRWCVFEWCYGAIDYPWFAKSDLVEYLYHVGLGHTLRLTHAEWGVIRRKCTCIPFETQHTVDKLYAYLKQLKTSEMSEHGKKSTQNLL
ncbi:hypothetical protein Nepgr_030266 [Nepenthes gracilis]|uniref:DIRP domain-containing protein n=1 Tax=Nepenthes gracilis TaxID=150966 RepID=A0AAD3Y419_NEPGR|nr:hypothetical protein Nepgr_030266 [Nepenthes gracilis]